MQARRRARRLVTIEFELIFPIPIKQSDSSLDLHYGFHLMQNHRNRLQPKLKYQIDISIV